MSDFGVSLIQLTNYSPIFKGGAIVLVGLCALLFAYWLKARWKEPLEGRFLVFIGVACFVTLFGLFVLIFQPQWWKLPY
ncbi:MAG: hypothetical protein WC632_00630 [Candidatus Margulisiibacteriota bacterium]